MQIPNRKLLNHTHIILEKCYLDLGGGVTYRSTVEKILVEKDNAVGVRLSNSEEYRGDHIVSAADGHSTLYDLLDGKYLFSPFLF